MEQDYNKMKDTYINTIIELLKKSNDISLLDLIKKLLEKSI
jgi:hypothetical protein